MFVWEKKKYVEKVNTFQKPVSISLPYTVTRVKKKKKKITETLTFSTLAHRVPDQRGNMVPPSHRAVVLRCVQNQPWFLSGGILQGVQTSRAGNGVAGVLFQQCFVHEVGEFAFWMNTEFEIHATLFRPETGVV